MGIEIEKNKYHFNKFVVSKCGQTLRTSDSLSDAKKYIETEIINKTNDGNWLYPELEGCEQYLYFPSDNSKPLQVEILQTC